MLHTPYTVYLELPDYFALLKSGNIIYRYTINVPSSWHSCRPYMSKAIVISPVIGYFGTTKTINSDPTKTSSGYFATVINGNNSVALSYCNDPNFVH
jgi:hypothetical protein